MFRLCISGLFALALTTSGNAEESNFHPEIGGLVGAAMPLSILRHVFDRARQLPTAHREFREKGWEGGASNVTSNSGSEYCFLVKSYESGRLQVSLTSQGLWKIGYQDPSWPLDVGEGVKIVIVGNNELNEQTLGLITERGTMHSVLPTRVVDFVLAKNIAVNVYIDRYKGFPAIYLSPDVFSNLRSCIENASKAGSSLIRASAHRVGEQRPISDASGSQIDDVVWQGVRNSKDPGRYSSYLELFPNSRHAPEAREQMEAIEFETPPLATPPPYSRPGLSENGRQSLTDSAPDFVPWPPPMPTATYPYPTEWVQKHQTVGEVSADIEQSLRKSGYTQFSYSLIDGGFALATRFERIEQREAPSPEGDRWAPLGATIPQSWREVLKALLFGREDRCRLFVFFLTTGDMNPSRDPATIDEARIWSKGGAPSLPSTLKNIVVTDRHKAYVYEYEFVKERSDQIEEVKESYIPLDQQLRSVKLIQ